MSCSNERNKRTACTNKRYARVAHVNISQSLETSAKSCPPKLCVAEVVTLNGTHAQPVEWQQQPLPLPQAHTQDNPLDG